MITSMLLYAALMCPSTVMTGFDPILTVEDTRALNRAKFVCSVKYAPRSPCLVKFVKKADHDYAATCGAKR